MAVDLSICVLAFNHPDLLPDCVASIDAQEIPCSHEKVLVDNGSTPTLPVPKGWRGVYLPQNRGNIGGQNACFDNALGEWVLFVANDVRLKPRFIRQIMKETTRPHRRAWTTGYARFLCFQPTLLRPNYRFDNCGLVWMWPGYGLSNWRQCAWEPSAFSGSCYLMPKQIWQQLKGFDEQLHSSHEDIDFCLSARKQLNVWPVHVVDALAIHLGNATLKHTLTNPRQVFHQARLKVIDKHYRGLNRFTRRWAVQVIDGFHSAVVRLRGIPS